MRLFLEPMDVWLFRDGKPFSAGNNHRARSLFPPLPTTAQGMVRSYHLLCQRRDIPLSDKARIKGAVGGSGEYPPGFRMRGPFVAREEGEGEARRIWRYFPLPADATVTSGGHRSLAPVHPAEGVLTSAALPGQDGKQHPLDLLIQEGEPAKQVGEWWLRQDELVRYLGGKEAQATPGQPPSMPMEDLPGYLSARASSGEKLPLYLRESRFGIGLDPARRTTMEGMLFEVEYIRPLAGVGLDVEVDWLHGGVDALAGWPERGMLAAGGEGRGARFRRVNADPLPAPPDPLPRRFKLYLATPTYFARGWQPADWGRFFEGPAPGLVAAAVGRYQSLGGFDLAAARGDPQAHRPARRYVPAGSVYFFETKGETRLRWPSLTDDVVEGEGPGPLGWGQVLVHEW